MTSTTEPFPRISERTGRYPFPRTAADMRKAREAMFTEHSGETHLCPGSSEHGPMVPRPLAGQTYEQMFCGIWFDCKNGCTGAMCITSRDLAFERGEPYRTPGGWEKWDGRQWVSITDAEADEFWAARKAWQAALVDRRVQRGPMPAVTYDGRTYKVRSRKTVIPDLASMDRMAALIWLNENTFARGAGIRTKPDPLAGMGGAISLRVR